MNIVGIYHILIRSCRALDSMAYRSTVRRFHVRIVERIFNIRTSVLRALGLDCAQCDTSPLHRTQRPCEILSNRKRSRHSRHRATGVRVSLTSSTTRLNLPVGPTSTRKPRVAVYLGGRRTYLAWRGRTLPIIRLRGDRSK